MIPDEVLYHVPAMHLSPSLLVWALIVGPVLGFAGVGFVKLTNRLQGIAPKGWRLLVVLPVVFAMVGLIAVPFPEILGNGRALGLVAMNASLDDAPAVGLAPSSSCSPSVSSARSRPRRPSAPAPSAAP